MTLVVARQFQDLLFILADTQVSNAHTVRREAPFLKSVSKVVPIGPCVIAYAGNVHLFECARNELDQSMSSGEIHSVVARHIQSSSGELDAIVVDMHPNRITEYKTEPRIGVSSSWIGSFDAFSRYQQLASQGPPNDEHTFVSLTKMPETADDEHYRRSFAAFAELAFGGHRDVGGLVTPYIISPKTNGFASYGSISRPPINAEDLTEKRTAVNFGDAVTGSFGLTFWGDAMSFAAHLAFVDLGISFSTNQRILSDINYLRLHKGVDEIDFMDEVQMLYRLGPGIRFSGSPANYAIKAQTLLQSPTANNVSRASELVDRGFRLMTTHWKANGVKLSTGIVCLTEANLFGQQVEIPTGDDQLAVFFLKLRVQIELSRGNITAASIANQELHSIRMPSAAVA